MTFKNKIELRYNDSDQMGVIYHANYFTFFEQSRTGLLLKLGFDYYDIEESGYLFPVREVFCTYMRSIRLGEKVFCETKLIKSSKVKLVFNHVIKNEKNEIKAEGSTSIICVRKEDFKICKMDSALPQLYELIKTI